MFNTFARSWALVRASFRVLMSDQELVIFPVISSIALLAVTAVFVLPLALTAGTGGVFTEDGLSIVGVIVLFLYYTASYTVIIFANSALVGAALIRLRGGDPTISDGFRIAGERFGKILGYALIAATVGTVLQIIRERVGAIGQIVIGLVGMAWNLATYLVIPVLVTEDVGPIEAVKRSAGLLKDTWGSQIVGNFSISGIFFLVGLAVTILIGVPLFAIGANANSGAVAAIAVIAIILIWAIIALISSTLQAIYTAALYRYATTGDAGEFFDSELVQSAFRAK
ncbi:MAG: hypothetical protein GYB67_01680 [Chloroflexi bacterium]|nr:hypothetical protein [Chloroflexota bacterium]